MSDTEKGLDSPRLTPDHIDSKIKAIRYLTGDVAVGWASHDYQNDCGASTLTICILSLENGFTVTGEAHCCINPEDFDKLSGQKRAYENARNKIWQMEGYLLKEKLSNR